MDKSKPKPRSPILLFCYLPVIHQGYLDLFYKMKDQVDALVVPDELLQKKAEILNKDIRAIPPFKAVKIIRGLEIFPDVYQGNILELQGMNPGLVFVTKDHESQKMARLVFSDKIIRTVDPFLKWDQNSVIKSVDINFDRVSTSQIDAKYMKLAFTESDNSTDWWRHVGAIVTKDSEVIAGGYNKGLPSDHIAYMEGNPRDYVEAGTLSEISTTMHGEQFIIADAAKKGISLDGASMYLTVFPCPACVKSIAVAGIKKIYFVEGNAYLHSEELLRQYGVEIVWINMANVLSP